MFRVCTFVNSEMKPPYPDRDSSDLSLCPVYPHSKRYLTRWCSVVTLTGRKQRENTGVWLTFYSVQDPQLTRWCHPHSGWVTLLT